MIGIRVSYFITSIISSRTAFISLFALPPAAFASTYGQLPLRWQMAVAVYLHIYMLCTLSERMDTHSVIQR